MARRSQRVRYGPGRGQFGVLRSGQGVSEAASVIVLVHGGFWRWPVNRWAMWLVARDATRRGHTVFNIEYRRLGRLGGGGGWPQTFDDVADGLAAIKQRFPHASIFLVGHSAGGHLALVTAARHGELVDGVVAISAPTDLRLLSERGSDKIDSLVAQAPPDVRWTLTSPIEMLPIGVPTVCVHGGADTTIRPDMSIRFVEAATAAGDDARLVLVPGEDHRSALMPSSRTWKAALASVDRLMAERKIASRDDGFLTMGLR